MKSRLLILITVGWFFVNLGWAAPPFPVPAKGGLPECKADLAVCTGDLDSCDAAFDTCTMNLTTCDTYLGSCNADLNDVTGELMQCESDLAQCQTVTYPAPVPQTGQTICVGPTGGMITRPIDCAGTGQDGDLQAGVPLPRPRFTDNGDGTVTDNASGLRWLKDVGCLGNPTFNDLFDAVASLNADTDLSCTDYLAGTFNDWRFANIRELLSLIDYAYYSPPISNTQGDEHWSEGDPFVNVQVSVDGAPALIRSSTAVSSSSPSSIFALRIPAGAPVQVIGPASVPQVFIWAVRGPE